MHRIRAMLLPIARVVGVSAIAGLVIGPTVVLIDVLGSRALGSGQDFRMNLITELIGVWMSVAVTVLIVDRLNDNRDTERLKAELVQRAGSSHNPTALAAIAQLRDRGWLTGRNGLLRGANLTMANLHGAEMNGANLYGANMELADLRHSSLINADLRNARLGAAQLQSAYLSAADLLGAKFAITSTSSKHFRQRANAKRIMTLGEDYKQIQSNIVEFERLTDDLCDTYNDNLPELTTIVQQLEEVAGQKKSVKKRINLIQDQIWNIDDNLRGLLNGVAKSAGISNSIEDGETIEDECGNRLRLPALALFDRLSESDSNKVKGMLSADSEVARNYRTLTFRQAQLLETSEPLFEEAKTLDNRAESLLAEFVALDKQSDNARIEHLSDEWKKDSRSLKDQLSMLQEQDAMFWQADLSDAILPDGTTYSNEVDLRKFNDSNHAAFANTIQDIEKLRQIWALHRV